MLKARTEDSTGSCSQALCLCHSSAKDLLERHAVQSMLALLPADWGDAVTATAAALTAHTALGSCLSILQRQARQHSLAACSRVALNTALALVSLLSSSDVHDARYDADRWLRRSGNRWRSSFSDCSIQLRSMTRNRHRRTSHKWKCMRLLRKVRPQHQTLGDK